MCFFEKIYFEFFKYFPLLDLLQKKCPNSLRFSTIKQECDWPTSVQCGTRPITSTATGAGNECSCFAGVSKCYNTDISSCNQFFVCVNGTQYNQKCPSGLHDKYKNWYSKLTFSYATFYSQYHFEISSGLRWSTAKKECEWPVNVNCGNRPVTIQITPGSGSASQKSCTCPAGKKVFFLHPICCLLVTVLILWPHVLSCHDGIRSATHWSWHHVTNSFTASMVRNTQKHAQMD